MNIFLCLQVDDIQTQLDQISDVVNADLMGLIAQVNKHISGIEFVQLCKLQLTLHDQNEFDMDSLTAELIAVQMC